MARLDYKLDDLDWTGFEQLVQALLKAKFGLGVEAWGGGGDWGRDAWFVGKLRYPTNSLTEGAFLFQCKFIEGANAAGAKSARPLLDAVRKERVRIKTNLAASGDRATVPTCYVLFTNAHLIPATRDRIGQIVRNVLPDAKVCVHDGQDVCQWLRLTPSVAESFPQFYSHWVSVRRIGMAIFAMVIMLGAALGVRWRYDSRGHQEVITGQTNLNTRIASLETLLQAQLHQPPSVKDPGPSLNFGRALREWAAQYGLTPEQAQRDVSGWIAEVLRGSIDLAERARAEFLAKHFDQAASLWDRAAGEKLSRGRNLRDEQAELLREGVADLSRSGEALLAGGKPGEALIRYTQAIEYVPPNSLIWARLHTCVGRCHLRLSNISSNDPDRNHQLAIENIGKALTVLSRENSPEDWAWAKTLLSVTLWFQAKLVKQNRPLAVQLFSDSAAACRDALAVYSQRGDADSLSRVRLGLLVAMSSQAELSNGDEALRLYAQLSVECRTVLPAISAERDPQNWAMIQGNMLGYSLFYQAERAAGAEAARLFGEAATAYREALKGLSADQPEEWPHANHVLGKSLFRQSQVTTDKVESKRLLAEALHVYREALAMRWIRSLEARSEFVGILLAQAQDDEGDDSNRLIREAETEGRDVLKLCGTDKLLPCALVRLNLAGALLHRVMRQSVSAKQEVAQSLEEALQMCREALEIVSPIESPEQWLAAQWGLGNVLTVQARWCEGTEKRKMLNEARAAFRHALEIREFPQHRDPIESSLSEVERGLSELPPDFK